MRISVAVFYFFRVVRDSCTHQETHARTHTHTWSLSSAIWPACGEDTGFAPPARAALAAGAADRTAGLAEHERKKKRKQLAKVPK